MDDTTRIIREGSAREQLAAGLLDADDDAVHTGCGGNGCDGCNSGWATGR